MNGRRGWNIGQGCWAHTPAAAALPVVHHPRRVPVLLVVVLRAPLAIAVCTLAVPSVHLLLRPSGADLVLVVGVGVCTGAMVVVMGIAGWTSLSLWALGAVIGDVVAGVGGRVDGGVDVAVGVIVGVGAVRH
ncbi:hypothetical protein BDQ17DRAFT_1548863 [Cyathus striatus]|nr:hypothetical protein BDQ17DRAFT_1548863 [Cyathus striatus]